MSRFMCKFDHDSVCIDEFTDKNTLMDDCEHCPENPKNAKETKK